MIHPSSIFRILVALMVSGPVDQLMAQQTGRRGESALESSRPELQ